MIAGEKNGLLCALADWSHTKVTLRHPEKDKESHLLLSRKKQLWLGKKKKKNYVLRMAVLLFKWNTE